MRPSILRVLMLVLAIGGVPPALAAGGDSLSQLPGVPSSQQPVTLTINPDGSAVWNGQQLSSTPELEDKLANRAQQDPTLELDVHFHSVDALADSNRQTLLDILELSAKFGFVHVQTTATGARLTVLGPSAVNGAAK